MFDKFNNFTKLSKLSQLSAYKPYINYNWSSTYQADNQMYTKNIGNSEVNLANYAGKGTLFNGTNQSVALTTQLALATSMIYTLDGVQTYTETPFDFSGTPAGTYKDVYYFSDSLTPTEIAKYSTDPDGFFQDVVDGTIDNCVLNMPMEAYDTNGNRYDYSNGTTYQITNYTTSCDVANLPYGSQQTSFLKNELGLRAGRSEFFECDGAGYGDTGWVPDVSEYFINEIDLFYDKSSIASDRFGASENYIGRYQNGYLYSRLFGSVLIVSDSHFNDLSFNHIVREWNPIEKTHKVYVNGVLKTQTTLTTPNPVTIPFYIGGVNGTPEIMSKPINKFKVHNEFKDATRLYLDNNNINGFDVFMLAGQSNMVGWNGPIDPILDAKDTNIYQYGAISNELKVALDSLEHVNLLTTTIGMGISFAKTYRATNGENRAVLLLPCAKGGTSFSDGDWNSTGTQYLKAIEIANKAMATHPNNDFKGILWHQGEGDISLTTIQYSNFLDTLIGNFRQSINGATNKTPFICGELLMSGTSAINTALSDTENRVNDAYFVQLSDLTTTDGVHLDATSLRVMGERYANKYAVAKGLLS